MNKQYMGDSVYIEQTSGGIVLTTENGYGPSNTIFIEPQVFSNIILYLGIMNKKEERETIGICSICRRMEYKDERHNHPCE